MKNFEKLIEVIAKLRDPEHGCPWDLKQDHQSLIKYLIEESYEFAHAAENGNISEMEDELGDVLLQVVLHSQIASETKQFDIESVSKKITEKMIRRHPHVFNNPEKRKWSDEEIKLNWQKTKVKEAGDHYHITEKDNILPALMSSYKIGKKTQKLNFDWDHAGEVLLKVKEELSELEAEIKSKNQEKIHEEMGDLLFSVAQLARHLDIEPEHALKKANDKFIKRFQAVEDLAKKNSTEVENTPRPKLEEYWKQVKLNE